MTVASVSRMLSLCRGPAWERLSPKVTRTFWGARGTGSIPRFPSLPETASERTGSFNCIFNIDSTVGSCVFPFSLHARGLRSI